MMETDLTQPVLALGLIRTATILLVARSAMLISLEQDYILFARAKGLGERVVYFRHALRNAFLPLYTNIMLELGMVISGALVIETVFNYPTLAECYKVAAYQAANQIRAAQQLRRAA